MSGLSGLLGLSHSADVLGSISPGWEPQTQATERGDSSGECQLRDSATGGVPLIP